MSYFNRTAPGDDLLDGRGATRRSGHVPLVSVVTPTFNSAAYIAETIESVCRQTLSSWELIISDDASTDETVEVVKAIAAREPRVRLLTSTMNRGAAATRNEAIAAAAGRYIAFLDSDDLWKPEKLERQIEYMRQRDVAFTFTAYDRIDEDGQFLTPRSVPAAPLGYRELLKSPVIGCLTAVYDTAKAGKVYMPDIRKRQDFGLWLRLLQVVEYAHPIDESLATYRVRRQSVSANKLDAALYTWRIYREVERLSLPKAAYYFAHYAVRGFWNHSNVVREARARMRRLGSAAGGMSSRPDTPPVE